MPLFADGLKKIRNALLLVQAGKSSPIVKVGVFTAEQLRIINEQREMEGLDPIEAIIVFNGKHLYKSRCLRDGYTIEDVLVQIQSAFSDTAEVLHKGTSTVMANRAARTDSEGNAVYDRVVFECSEKKPLPLLWSVVPKGDGRKQAKN